MKKPAPTTDICTVACPDTVLQHLQYHAYVKALVRWVTGKSLTNRLPKQSLMTLLRLCGCATPGIPSTVCLLSRFSLLLNCLGCVEIEDSSFIPFQHNGRLSLGPETPGFLSKIRLLSNTNTIPIPVPRQLPVFHIYSRQYQYTRPYQYQECF